MKNKKNIFNETAKELVDALGGYENISDAFFCATRFRVVLKDNNKTSKKQLQEVQNSKGVVKEGEQWQIIFGAGTVNKVFDSFEAIYQTDKPKATGDKILNDKVKWDPNFSWGTNFWFFMRNGIRGFAQIFIPLIPLFIVGGLSLAFNNFIRTDGIGMYKNDAGELVFANAAAQIFSLIFDTVGGAILGSLPVLIGYTSAKKWGGNPWFGAAIGLSMIAGTLANPGALASTNGFLYYSLLNGFQGSETVRWVFDNEVFTITQAQLLDESVLFEDLNLPSFIENKEQAIEAFNNAGKIPMFWDANVFALGIPIFSAPLLGYQGQVVPILILVAIAVKIEKFMKKISHESIAILSVPLVTVIFSVILGFIIIGPIGRLLGAVIAEFFSLIFTYLNFPGFGLGGALIGAMYPPLVITGLHQGILPIEATLISTTGVSWITPVGSASNIGQGIAALSAMLFLRDKKTAGTALSGGISANLGITEPAIFGVNIPLKFVFLGGMIGAAFGGYWLGMTQTVSIAMGSASWLGAIQFNFTPNEFVNTWYANLEQNLPYGNLMQGFGLEPGFNFIIAMTITSIATFVSVSLMALLPKNRKTLEEINKRNFDNKFTIWLGNMLEKIGIPYKILRLAIIKEDPKKITYVYAPIDGQLLQNNQIEDAGFKDNLMGYTFAIKPKKEISNVEINSPIKGKVSNIFPTGHAFIVQSKAQVSVLVHVGSETAKLNVNAKNLRKLKYFRISKLIGANVKKESKLVEFRKNSLVKAGAKNEILYNIILNETMEDKKIKIYKKEGFVKAGDVLAKITSIS